MAANLSTTVAATMTVLIGMFLLGVSIGLGTWVVSWTEHVKSQLEVKVVFVDDVPQKQIKAAQGRLDQMVAAGSVKNYEFVSRAEALERMKKLLPGEHQGLGTNPYPAIFEVAPADADNVKEVARELRAAKLSGVDEVKDGEKLADSVLERARIIQVVFLIFVIVLLIASVLLISNTIRLSVFSRRREIEVMKLVGATNWFVRGPFMLEGLLCGLIGAVAAIFLLMLAKAIALPSFDTYDADGVQGMAFGLNALILVFVGLAVGALGSGLSLRRFLQV